MKRLLLIFTIAIIFYSCDPATGIYLSNKTDHNFVAPHNEARLYHTVSY